FAAHRPRSASGSEHWRPSWRQFRSEGGGVIADLGYHGFYLASRIFGTAPRAVSVVPNQGVGNFDEAEGAAFVELIYDGNRQASLSLSWQSTVRKTVLHVFGSTG